MKPRALFEAQVVDGVICIVDRDEEGYPSVTNDVEAVVAHLAVCGVLLPGRRVIYRDSTGTWDEIVWWDGKFVDFRPLGCESRAEALAKLKLRFGGEGVP